MTKRLLALLTALMLMLSCLGYTAFAEEKALPEAGQVVEGFKVLELAPFPLLDATCVLMEHEKTKAKLVYAACDDIDRTFSITFRTFAQNDKGIPHVFEHSTLSGNAKYPDPSLFFTMMSQTYQTYLNAATHPTATTFPCASLSEEQLYAFTDYVLSGVFHPTIMTDERAMMREAYRYELTGEDQPITLTGTVYSEMQGSRTLVSIAYSDMQKALYPGSANSNIAGGDPAVIPDMTWQEIKDFHDTYYHPSNSLMLLYGDIDLSRFLRLINEDYLSEYDYRQIEFDDSGYQPYEGYREVSSTFPTAQGDTSQPVTFYGFSLDGASYEESVLISFAADALSMEGSTFMKAMRQKMPDAMGGVSVEQNTVEPTLIFVGLNVDESGKELFKSIVDQTIANVLANGLDMGQIEGLCSQQAFSSLASREQSAKGIMLSTSMTEKWQITDDPFAFIESANMLLNLESYIEKDAFNAAFRTYMTDPARSVLLTMTADPGGLEANSAALEEALAQRKAAMSDEEIQALIERTEDFAKWTQDNARSSMIDQIKVVASKDLPVGVVRYEANVEERDGLKVVTSEVDGGELVMMSLRLDASTVPFEMLHEYTLLSVLPFSMPTVNYKLDELTRETSRVLFSPSITASLVQYEDGSSRPELVVSWLTTGDKLDESFNLMEEVLFRTDLSQTAYFSQLLSGSVVNAYYALVGSPDTLAMTQSYAMLDSDADYLDYIGGMGIYHFLIEKCVDLKKPQLNAMLSTIQAVRSIVLNKRGAVATCVGTRENIDAAVNRLQEMYAKLGNVEYPIADYKSKLPARKQPLAIDIGGTIQYNMQTMLLKDTGFDESGKMLAMNALVLDKLLIPILRFENSVYSVSSVMDDPLVYVMTINDPSIGKTYDFYGEIGQRLRDMELTQEELEGYIVSAYSSLATPYGPLAGGYAAVNDAITGEDTFGKAERRMKELKAFELSDVAAYSAIYDMLSERGAKVTIGGAQAIGAERDLFAAVDKTLVQ